MDTHCPEIDILIHDSAKFRALFKMGDFAIVQPRSVKGIVQVKRAFNRKQVWRGLKNVIEAKQHLLNTMFTGQPDSQPSPGIPPRIFTAVVGFEDELGSNTKFYRRQLVRWHKKHRVYDRKDMIETSMYVLPSFIGALNGSFLYLDGPGNFLNQFYFAYESEYGGKNLCIQALLAKMRDVWGADVEMPPFAFPKDLPHHDCFAVLQVEKVEVDLANGTAKLSRNDGWTMNYAKAVPATENRCHVVCEPDGKITMTDLLKQDIMSPVLWIKRPDGSGIDIFVPVNPL
jgi:hypothetical protein